MTARRRRAGVAIQRMLLGALVCAIGIAVTAVAAAAVRAAGGGAFIIASGVILYGGYQFLAGFFQLIGSLIAR